MSNTINQRMISTFGEMSPVDVANETLGVVAIDLTQCAISLSYEENEALLQAPNGVYSGSSIEPVLNFDREQYFSYNRYKAQLDAINAANASGHDPKTVVILPDIRNYEDFQASSGPIFNSYGRQVFVAHPSTKKSTSPLPSFNYGAIHVAFIAIWDHFNQLSRASKPVTNIPSDWLRYSSYVKPTYLKKPLYKVTEKLSQSVQLSYGLIDPYANQAPYSYYEEGEYSWNPWKNHGLAVIYEQLIDPFVGRDLHNQYRLNLAGSMLYIEKGHDIRVIEFQRMIWEHMESIRYETHTGFRRS